MMSESDFSDIFYGKRAKRLPSLQISEIEDIVSFVQKNQRIISYEERIILDRMIDNYEIARTLEARQELKTFLIYLRRCVCPSPSVLPSTPKSQIRSESRYVRSESRYIRSESHYARRKSLPQFQETPKRRVGRTVSDRGFCRCEQCRKKRRLANRKTLASLSRSTKSSESVFHQTIKLFRNAIKKGRK